MVHRLLSAIRPAARFAALVAALLLVVGFFGALHPALDAPSNLRLQLSLALLALAAFLLPWRRLALAAASLGVLGILTSGANSLLPARAALANPAAPTYRLLQMNLYFLNPTPEKALELIARVKPDVMTLDEVAATEWLTQLDGLRNTYPSQLRCGDVAILSRLPFEDDGNRCAVHDRYAVASIKFGGTPVDVAAIHLRWPWPRGQARQIEGLSPELEQLSDHAILAGDFNAATWSAALARVAALSGATTVPGLGTTWLALPLPRGLKPVGLAIDHVLTKGVTPQRIETLEDIGSDHWPVLMEFSVPPTEDTSATS